MRQQSEFGDAARHDRVCKTLVSLVKPPQLAASFFILIWRRLCCCSSTASSKSSSTSAVRLTFAGAGLPSYRPLSLSARSGLCLRPVGMARYSVLASVLQNRRQRNRQIIGHDARNLAERLLRATVRKRCKSVPDIDAREDPMRTVRAHIEYRWNSNPEVGFEATKSEVNNSVTIDGIDALAAVVLVELARQSLERDHARSVEEFLRFGGGVVVVVVVIRTFAEAWIRTAIGPK
jgi:hypothetical protein